MTEDSLLEARKFFEQTILERYDTDHHLRDLMDKINRGDLTGSETEDFEKGFQAIIMKFKTDLAKIEPGSYTRDDLKLIIAMSDANFKLFEGKEKTLVKVIPFKKARCILNGESPDIASFVASSLDVEGLSPQQTVDMLGLDYKGSPYLHQDNKEIKQPLMTRVEAPVDADVMDKVRAPMDPRVVGDIASLARDPDADEKTRRMAASWLGRYKDRIMLAVRKPADVDSDGVRNALRTLRDYHSDPDIDIARRWTGEPYALDPPYTGHSAPMSMDKDRRTYTAVGQEMNLTTTIKPTSGWKISVMTARPDADPDDPATPAGIKPVVIAQFQEGSWRRGVTSETFAAMFRTALEPLRTRYGDPSVAEWESQCASLGGEIGKLKSIEPPEALKKHIKNPKKKIKASLTRDGRRRTARRRKKTYAKVN